MDSVLRLVGCLFTLLTVAMTLAMVLTFRKERRIGLFAPLISGLLSLVLLPIFIALSGASLNLCIGLPILILGGVLGYLRGQTTKMYYKDSEVVGRASIFFLLLWGVSLILAQLLNIVGSVLLSAIGLIPLFFSTGTQVGLNANIFLRRLLLQSKAPTPQVQMTDEGAFPETSSQEASEINVAQGPPSRLPEIEAVDLSPKEKRKPSSLPEWGE